MSAENLLRKAAAAGAAFGAAFLANRVLQAAAPRLLVFVHVAVKQRALQSELQSHLPGIDVTAVGRVGDFDRALKEGADAALTLSMVLSAHGLSPKLYGHRKGSKEEPYSLVAPDAAPDPARVATVGALDVLGRDGTTTFVHNLLGARPKVERVTKVEDLLPLLQMQRADAILLPTRLYSDLRGASRLKLAQRELSGKVGLPAVAIVGSAGAQVVAAIAKMSASECKALGVEEWR
jgi:hypothetical protein